MSFKRYFLAELKRISRLLPKILLLALIFFGVILLVGKLLVSNSDAATGKNKYCIGVLANEDNSFIKMGMYLFESFDDSRYLIEIVHYDELEVAKRELEKGTISALAVIPDDFVDGITMLSNDAVITYYTVSGEGGLTSVYMDEITNIASNYIKYSEAVIFSLIDYLNENGYSSNVSYDETGRLFLTYVGAMTDRGNLTEVKNIGIGNGLSTYGYYVTGLSLFFVCILSFAGISFFLDKNRSLEKLIFSKGIGPVKQIVADAVLYFICNALCTIIYIVPVLIFIKTGPFEIEEFSLPGAGDCLTFLAALLVATILITLCQMLVFEIFEGTINKIIFSFVIILGAAYVSGLLYPKSFFPKGIQRFGEILPTGVASSFVASTFTVGFSNYYLALAIGYGVILFLALCGVRRYKIKK